MHPWKQYYSKPEFSDEDITSIYETETDTKEPMMAGESENTNTSKETKKKLKTLMPYTGKREDLWKLFQEIKIYLLANGEAYPIDLDKILFMLSYIVFRGSVRFSLLTPFGMNQDQDRFKFVPEVPRTELGLQKT